MSYQESHYDAESFLDLMLGFFRRRKPDHEKEGPAVILDNDACTTVGREFQRLTSSCADDIRADGWTVAVHNDYRLDGKAFTFWLFTKTLKNGTTLAVKGEGSTDEHALNDVRAQIHKVG